MHKKHKIGSENYNINMWYEPVGSLNDLLLDIFTAVILLCYNISNPGPMELEPGWELAAIAFLCESFYVC